MNASAGGRRARESRGRVGQSVTWGPGGEGRGHGRSRPLSGRSDAVASAYSGPGESASFGTGLAAPPPHAGRPGGEGRIRRGLYQRAGKKLGRFSPTVHDTLERQPPLPLPPHSLLCFLTPVPLNFPPQGMGLRRPDKAQLCGAERGRPRRRKEVDKKGVRGPQPRGAAPAGPLPSLGSAEGPVRPQPLGLGGREGRGAPSGPGTHRRRESSARGWREPGLGGPGRGRAPTHLPAGAAARARGQRGAAPGVHVVGDAEHPQEGEAEQHPRAPPHPPHSAAGRGAAARECCLGPAGGAEEGEGRGAAPPPARAPAPAGGGGARSAPSSALGRERRAARRPSRKRRLRRRPGGSESKGRPIGGRRGPGAGGGRDHRVPTAAARRPPRPLCVLPPRPSAPVSDRWLPGPGRSARTRAVAHGHTQAGHPVPAASRCRRDKITISVLGLRDHLGPLTGSLLLALRPARIRLCCCSLQFS